MVVAVNPDALAGLFGRSFGDGAGAAKEVEAAREQERCGVGGEGFGVGEGGEGALEGFEGAGQLRIDAIGVGLEGRGGEGLGGEGWVVRGCGEGEVHLGGAAAEQGCGVEVKAGVLAGFGGDLCSRGLVEETGCGADVVGRWEGGDGLVVLREFVQSELPAVALVFDEALEHGERGG